MIVTAVIPARYASVRLPAKPLLDRTGKFLIQHVYERAVRAGRIDRVIVATDDERIAQAVRGFGGWVELTRPDHPSGTDRVAEVAERMGGDPDDIVLNVQGDEPEIEPDALDRLVERLIREGRGGCPAATLAAPFPDSGTSSGGLPSSAAEASCVKVVTDLRGRALYFSRSLIPYRRDADAAGHRWLLHLGVYAYRRAFLLSLAGREPTPLERVEKLEQLRVIEHGHSMAVEVVDRAFVGIDTPADYEAFVERFRRRSSRSEARVDQAHGH